MGPNLHKKGDGTDHEQTCSQTRQEAAGEALAISRCPLDTPEPTILYRQILDSPDRCSRMSAFGGKADMLGNSQCWRRDGQLGVKFPKIGQIKK